MSRQRVPLVIHVPPAFARGRCSFDQVVARALPAEVRHHTAWRFALSSDERRFARALLDRRPQLWLYRTDQQGRAGDFLAVDMSAPRPDRRRLWAIEVKLGAAVRFGGGGASNQLVGVARAAAALSDLGVVQAAPVLVCGDGLQVAALIGARR
jgi:hypothetical protein